MVVCAKEANTAPAPTEGSWFSSPNRMTRQPSGTARRRLSIRARSSIEASSIIRMSSGSGLSASNCGCICGGRSFNRRWTVWPSSAERCRLRPSEREKPARALCRARAMCAAALPVGAASAMRGRRSRPWQSRASSLATVVVLPVPGPPEIKMKFCSRASAAAACWPSLPAWANHSASNSAVRAVSGISAGGTARRRISPAKSRSSR